MAFERTRGDSRANDFSKPAYTVNPVGRQASSITRNLSRLSSRAYRSHARGAPNRPLTSSSHGKRRGGGSREMKDPPPSQLTWSIAPHARPASLNISRACSNVKVCTTGDRNASALRDSRELDGGCSPKLLPYRFASTEN